MFRFLLPTPVLLVAALLILIPPATAWGNPVQTTSNESFLPTEEAFPTAQAAPAKAELPPPKEVMKLKRRFGHLIGKVATKVGVDKQIVQGIVYMESRGNPRALNMATDAKGLMGITPIAQKQVGCGSIDTPEKNLLCGSTYLLYLCDELEICGVNEMLLAYLMGPARMQKVVKKNPWAPYTHPYVLGVIEAANFRGS